VPLQTMCMSNSSLSSRKFVRVHLFEAASQLVFVRPALARTSGIVSVYGVVSHFGAIYLYCIIQVWARGMVKKRPPHAHSPGNFKELKCYK